MPPQNQATTLQIRTFSSHRPTHFVSRNSLLKFSQKVDNLEVKSAISEQPEDETTGTVTPKASSKKPEKKFPANPLKLTASKKYLAKKNSKALQNIALQQKFNHEINSKIVSTLEEVQKKGLFARPSEMIDFTFVKRMLFLHDYDELQVFDKIQEEIVSCCLLLDPPRKNI